MPEKKDKSGNLVAELKGDGKRPIHCMIWFSDEPLLKKVKPGDAVTFLGRLKVSNAGKLQLVEDKVELSDSVLTHVSGVSQ